MGDNVKVAVRLRKLIQREEEQKAETFWRVNDNSVSNKIDAHRYDFDRVFDQAASTTEIYDELVAPILDQAMIGINGTVFAYGQTSSGKTYTMLGDNNSIGIIPMCASAIYNEVENRPDREFLVRVSYMEIYNENVVDLLSDEKTDKKSLNVYDTVDGKVVVKDLTEEVVTSEERIRQLLKHGEAARRYGATNMNERSSRSHAIFRVIIESRERVADPRASFNGTVFGAHLNLVDLAGSEKVRLTGATGQRLTEGGFINKSLLTLSQVINQLASNSDSHIPYRDSKLTRILQNALGGNSKTAIICAVTPASFEETHSTLRFASSAKKITNRPQINELFSDDTQMGRMQREIARLKHQLEMKKQDDGDTGKVLAQTMNKELQQKLEEKERLQQEQEEKIQRLLNLISVSSRLKPVEDEDSRQKKRRRETWCPGKERHSMAHNFPKFGAGPMQCLVEEPVDASVTEDECLPSAFPPQFARDIEIKSTTQAIETQTIETQTDLVLVASRGNVADEIVMERLKQRVADQDATIEELRVSLDTMEDHYNKLLYTKDTELAVLSVALELRSSNSVANTDCMIQAPEQLDSTVCVQSVVCDSENVIELKERLCKQERENSELVISLKNTSEELARAQSQCASDGQTLSNCINELETTKAQLSESMLFCASLVEKMSALESRIEELKEDKKSCDLAYGQLVAELQELSEFTKYEKEYRDTSFVEKQEKAHRDLTEQLVSMETQLKASRDREKMLAAALSEQEVKSDDAVLTRPMEPERMGGDMISEEIQTEAYESNSNLEDKIQHLERALEESTRQVDELRNQISELERVSREQTRKDSPPEPTSKDSCTETDSTDSVREAELNQHVRSLEEQLSVTMRELEELKTSLKEQASLAIDAQNEVLDLKEEVFAAKNALAERQEEISRLLLQLETKSKVLEDHCTSLASEKSLEDDTNDRRTGKFLEHMDESQAFNDLHSKYDKAVSELKVTRDQLLVSSNKDLELQRCRADLERVVKETNTAVARSNQENKVLIDRLNKEVCELSCQLQKSSCDLQLAEHRLAEAEKAKAQLRCEMTAAEGLISRQEFGSRKGPGDADPEKLLERIKKLTVMNDLTTQRCQNYEAKIKSMEVAAQKYESMVLERDSLQLQLREAQHQFHAAREESMKVVQARNNSYSETAQMTLHVANLEARLQNAASQKAALQDQLENVMKEQQYSTESLEKMSNEILQKTSELDSVNQKFIELSHQVDVLRNELQAKTNENLKESESRDLDRNARESEYRLQLDVLSEEKEALQSQLKLLQDQKITLEVEVERVMAESEAFKAELGTIRNQLTEEVLAKGRRQSGVSSDKSEPPEDQIKKVRSEEEQKWTKLMQEAVEKQTKDSETQRRQEILQIQKMTTEKLDEILKSHEKSKQEELVHLREQHQQQLVDIESTANVQVQDLNGKLGELRAENENLRSSLTAQDELRHRLEQDLREMESEKSDIEVIMTNKEAEIEELEHKLREISEELDAVRQQERRNGTSMISNQNEDQLLEALKKEHQEQMDEKESELKTLKQLHADEIKLLEKNFCDERALLSSEHQSHIESLEQKYSTALEESEKEKTLLEQRLEDLRLICDEEMKDSDSQRQSYERKSAESAEQQEMLTQRVSKLLEMLESAEEKHSEACLVLAKLEDEHRCCVVSVSEKEQKIAQLQVEINVNREALLQKSELLTSLQETLVNTRTKNAVEIGELQSLVSAKETDVVCLKETVDKLTAELSVVNNNLRESEQALGHRVCEIEDLSKKLASQNAANEQEVKHRQELEIRFNDLKLQNDKLSVELQRFVKVESEVIELRQKLANVEGQRGRTELEISQETNQLKESLNEAEIKKAVLESEIVSLKVKIEKDELEIRELESENKELSDDMMDAGKRLSEAQEGERRNARMAADAPRLRRERNELRSKVSELEMQMNSLNCELSVVRAEAASSQNRHREEIERLKGEKGADELETKLKDSRSEAAKLMMDVSRLETKLKLDIDPLNAKLRSVASDLARSEAQVRKLKDEIANLKDENKTLRTSADEKKSLSGEKKPVKAVAASSFNPDMYSCGTLSGGGIISDFNYYSMQSECATYKAVNEKLKRQVTSLETKCDVEKETNAKLQRTIQDLEKKIRSCEQQMLAGDIGDVPRASPGNGENRDPQAQSGPASPVDVQKLLRETPRNPFELSYKVEAEEVNKCRQQ